MRFFVALLQRSFGGVRLLVGGLALVLAGLHVLIVLVAVSQQESQSFDLIQRLTPSFVQRQFGSALPTLLSFGGLVSFGFFHPVVVLAISLFAAFLSTELAADVEEGHVDLLLTRPVSRHWLVTRSLAVSTGAILLLVLVMITASRLALYAFAPSDAALPTLTLVATLAAHLVGVALCFGTLGLACAAVARRRMIAMTPVALAAVSLYLLEVLAGAWPRVAVTATISPFHYYQGTAVLMGSNDSARDFLVLGVVSLACASVAYWRFSARDV
jgi:ABC-2 type transport system permease protein